MALFPPSTRPDVLKGAVSQLPKRLREDAVQEAWTAYLESKNAGQSEDAASTAALRAVWCFRQSEYRHEGRHVAILNDNDGEPVAFDHDGKLHELATRSRSSDSSAAPVRRNSPAKVA